MKHGDLAGRTALVTGATGGIGRVVARALVGAGATVIGTHVEAQGPAEPLDGVQAAHLDQRSPASIAAVAGLVRERHGGLDILVNNAAWNARVAFGDLDALSVDIWDRVLETNLRGPFLLVRAFAPLLRAGGGGHVVNISSIGGIAPMGSSIAYACGKAGLNHLTRCLAMALAPQVAVNAIASGLVTHTAMADRAMDTGAQQAARDATLLGTGARAEDIAAQVLALVRARSITGQTLAIDGGVPGAMR
jgi:3-oxoacyl-[acyl-carrier protein] reductase